MWALDVLVDVRVGQTTREGGRTMNRKIEDSAIFEKGTNSGTLKMEISSTASMVQRGGAA